MGARRGTAERDRIPVDEDWDVPKDSRAWRGQGQLGSLGGGNHFIELQHDGERLWVMFHTGSRGFGHGLATHFFERAMDELGLKRGQMDLGYFTPRSRALALVSQRGGGGRQLRDREPPDDRPGGGGRVRGDVRRGAGARLRDQPQPRPGGAPSRPVRRARLGPSQGRDARAARRPPDAGGHALGDDRPSRDHPGLDGRLLVRAAAAARRGQGAVLRQPRRGPAQVADAARGARSPRPRPTAGCATSA